MARKGSEKKRTGCTTCKKRRVKCDETKPVCIRCHRGGRACTYLPPPAGSYSWQHLLEGSKPALSPSLLRLPHQEARNLDYFRCVVGPALGGPLGGRFWTKPVMQLALDEEAALHALLAISMLYEGFEPGWKELRNVDAAVSHYNHALRTIATKKVQNNVMLVVSVLFTCIEFLRANSQGAITHCSHGIILANSSTQQQGDEDVVAIVGELTVFPYFFASGEFPMPRSSAEIDEFDDLLAAAARTDQLMGRAIRLVRSLDGYRLELPGGEMHPCTWSAQTLLLRDLQRWKKKFEKVLASSDAHLNEPLVNLLWMRFLVCWIWVSIAPHKDECASDAYQDDMERIVKLAQESLQAAHASGKFTFSMGPSPPLHFVVIKCRHLPTRLAALDIMVRMNNKREALWNSESMYVIGKHIIEREHGIKVGAA